MNVLGVIVEYNPMHSGHVYHIEQAKKATNADYTIAIMSGSFTEQGNIGIFNKFDRAQTAIENGADLVIELPTIYAISSSENFGYGAVKILDSLGIVTHIAFGAECENVEILKSVASKLEKNELDIICNTKSNMKSGLSSASAADIALKEILDETEYMEFSKPNNLLGISYIRAIQKLGSKIEPVVIKRIGSNHSDLEIDSKTNFASSTTIRNIVKGSLAGDNVLSKLKDIVPSNTYLLFKTKHAKLTSCIWQNLKYQILRLGREGLKDIYEVSEGLENRLYEKCLISKDYDSFISLVKCKRYALSRIKRITIYILLEITKEMYIKLNGASYARILKTKQNRKYIIGAISRNTTIPLITHISDKDIKKLPEQIKESLSLDIMSTNIAGSFSDEYNLDYTNMI